VEFSIQHSTDKDLEHFQKIQQKKLKHRHREYHSWTSALNLIGAEWERIKEFSDAASAALIPDDTKN